MNYKEVKEGLARDTVTVEKIKPGPPPVVPIPPMMLGGEHLVVTAKRFSVFTGEEVAPVVDRIQKSTLLSEKENYEKQLALITANIAAIDEMLLFFEEPVVEEIVIK